MSLTRIGPIPISLNRIGPILGKFIVYNDQVVHVREGLEAALMENIQEDTAIDYLIIR